MLGLYSLIIGRVPQKQSWRQGFLRECGWRRAAREGKERDQGVVSLGGIASAPPPHKVSLGCRDQVGKTPGPGSSC